MSQEHRADTADSSRIVGDVVDIASLLEELSSIDELSLSILGELAEAPAPGAMSLPRLGKRLKQGGSVLLRQLTTMSDATVGGQPGPGWVRVERDEERWLAFITDAGREQLRHWLALIESAERAERAQALEEQRHEQSL